MNVTISKNDRFIRANDLIQMGFSYYKINKLVDEGALIKVNKSMYENPAYEGDESDFSIVSAYAPKGVFCMMSAARCYNLTSFLPDAVDIAIERSMKISTMPEWPAINVWYFPKNRYSYGITSFKDECGEYRIYDIEKTVIDILYYRNKVGIEETKEILKNYLARPERDLIQLRRYADALGCKQILGTYLEVLL